MMDLKDKKILITGGGGNGLAAGICYVLGTLGATLIVNEISDPRIKELKKKFNNIITFRADIADEREVKAMFSFIEKEVGSLDGLVNNAGVGLAKYAHETCVEEFDALYGIDVKGLWLVSKYFVNHLFKYGGSGNIVNISSIHALRTMNKYAIYSSAKAAVEGLTRGMAVEMGKHNIRVNAVGPGYVHSEQNQGLLGSITDDPENWVEDHINNYQAINSIIEAENCGNAIAFLLSNMSQGITGQTIYVDNGTSVLLYNNGFIKK